MAAYSLESLVLRGVSVLRDGQAVELCLGTNEAAAQMPGVRIFMQHPWPGYQQTYPNTYASRSFYDAKCVAKDAALGAGRLPGHASVLNHRRPASIAGRTSLSRESARESAKASTLPASARR
jgi:hypothetical protein